MPNLFDSRGNVIESIDRCIAFDPLMQAHTARVWRKHWWDEAKKESYFDNFLFVHILDQFGRPMSQVPNQRPDAIIVNLGEQNG